MVPITEFSSNRAVADPEILKKLKDQQQEQIPWFSTRGTGSFDEVAVAKEFYDYYNCENYIDIGCWTGIAAHFIKRVVQPKRMVLVDAIPTYLKVAADLFSDKDNVFAEELCILVRKDVETWKGYFLVDIDNTSWTSSVTGDENSPHLQKKTHYKLPTAEPTTISKVPQFIERITDISNSFIKIDIEGLDHYLCAEIINAGLRPPVIKFEMFTHSANWIQSATSLLNLLKSAGYSTPPTSYFVYPGAGMSNILVSKDRWAVQRYDLNPVTQLHFGGSYAGTVKNY